MVDRDYWTPGMDAGHRIPWRRWDDARDKLTDTFRSPGIYLWGARQQPLYLGMTRSTFRKRFGRYVWGERSQCDLADRYEDELIDRSIDGFPEKVREWYARNFRSRTVRLDGAVAFARAGIDDVWFALPPADEPDDVKEVEGALIPVAASWNREHGHPDFLNVQHL